MCLTDSTSKFLAVRNHQSKPVTIFHATFGIGAAGAEALTSLTAGAEMVKVRTTTTWLTNIIRVSVAYKHPSLIHVSNEYFQGIDTTCRSIAPAVVT